MPDHDETSDLNRILSEVIDFVQDVKQAGRKIPATQPLHGELDQLLDDVGAWARQLIEQDEILGVSPGCDLAGPCLIVNTRVDEFVMPSDRRPRSWTGSVPLTMPPAVARSREV